MSRQKTIVVSLPSLARKFDCSVPLVQGRANYNIQGGTFRSAFQFFLRQSTQLGEGSTLIFSDLSRLQYFALQVVICPEAALLIVNLVLGVLSLLKRAGEGMVEISQLLSLDSVRYYHLLSSQMHVR